MEQSPGCILLTAAAVFVMGLLGFLGVSTSIEQPAAPDITLYGIVYDQDSGQAVEGIAVALWRYPYANQSPDQSATTDANGRFVFHSVRVTETDAITITVQGGQNWYPQKLWRSGTDTLADSEFNFGLKAMQLGVGDLGWRALAGQVIDAVGGLPVEGTQVSYSHSSYMYNDLNPQQTALTDDEGHFIFDPIFIHDTDTIVLDVDKPGYIPLRVLRTGLETYWNPVFEIELSRRSD